MAAVVEIVIKDPGPPPGSAAAPGGGGAPSPTPPSTGGRFNAPPQPPVGGGGTGSSGRRPIRTPAQQLRRNRARRRLQRIRAGRRATAQAARQAAQQAKQAKQAAAAQAKQAAAQQAATRQRIAFGAAALAGGLASRGNNQQAGPAQQAGGIIGGTAGAVIGSRFGPAGAAIGQAVGQKAGEKIGARIDDPVMEVTQALRFVGKAARFTAEGLERVAGNDAIGAFEQGTHGAADVLEKIPVVGRSTSEALRTLGTVVSSVNRVMGAFAERGRELSGFQGNLAASTARQDVTRMMTDIKEAQKLGDLYAQLLDKQTEIEVTLQAGLMPIKEAVLTILPKMLDWMLDTSITVIEKLDKLLIGDYGLKEIATEMKEARRKFLAGAAMADPVGMWTGAAAGLGFAPPAMPPVAAPLGVPLVGR